MCTCTAWAKPWVELAPAPRASDSAYAALLERPADSLSAAQVTWLAVQRDWRAQFAAEDPANVPSSITSSATAWGHRHLNRSGDARFARLASAPFDALGDRDLAWLVVENSAQRDAREKASTNGARTAVGVGGLLVVAGLVGIGWLIVDAMADGFAHPFGN